MCRSCDSRVSCNTVGFYLPVQGAKLLQLVPVLSERALELSVCLSQTLSPEGYEQKGKVYMCNRGPLGCYMVVLKYPRLLP